jgi:hypothetical protein
MCACNKNKNNNRKSNAYRSGFQRTITHNRNMNITGQNIADPNVAPSMPMQQNNAIRPVSYDRLRIEKLRRDAINAAKQNNN